MKRALSILLLCVFICGSLCGCRNTTTAQSQGDPGASTDPKPIKQTLGSIETVDFANRTFRLTPYNFFDFFHYRIESADKGGEYDVLTYSVEMNASSDAVDCYFEGIDIDVSFDVTIKYVKEYTDSGLLYDTLTYPCQVKGRSEALTGIVDIQQIPSFKRNDDDTDHKKFTVLNVTPHITNVSGAISYSSSNHTYNEPVSYDTVPGFEIAANEDCITVYMMPKNKDYLYDKLAVEIELKYTYDTSNRPDQYIIFNEERVTIEGNLGGYGQYYRQIENGKGKPTRVVVSVVGVSGSVVQAKGYIAVKYSGN